MANVRRPQAAEISTLLGHAGSRGAIARGLGRSYGDAAQNGGGMVLDTRDLDQVFELDPDRGVVVGAAGLSLAALIRAALPLGWFIPVSPGTQHVTLGGAVAADVHGKNQHRDGNFCDHVEELVVISPSGQQTVTPSTAPDVFAATAGGMGLTGVVSSVRLKLLRVETAWMRSRVQRCANLEELLAAMTAMDGDHQYSVAWVDCVSRGRHLGRGVLSLADHAQVSDLDPSGRHNPLRRRRRATLPVPRSLPGGLINSVTIRAFNELWFRRAPRFAERVESISAFFYPLDAVADWNRLYGRRGFLQYQFVVPFGAESILAEALELLQVAGAWSSLAVLKRFGRGALGHLGFPIPGWTLALDLPVGTAGLDDVLCDLDERVAGAGGRVYLAKDSRLRPEFLGRMYPRLIEWRRVQAELDPGGVLQSDLSRRLGLVGPTAGLR